MLLPLLCATLPFVSPPLPLQGSDDCSNPTPLTSVGTETFNTTAATTSGFVGSNPCSDSVSDAHKDLFWSFTAPAGGHYAFDTFGSTFDTVLGIYRGSDCSATCMVRSDNALFLQSRVRVLDLYAGETVLVQVGGYTSPFPISPPEFGAGVLNIQTLFDPCYGQFAPDYIDENDSCDDAVAMGNGFYSNLSVSELDADFYTVEVAPGATLSVNIFDPVPQGDLILLLWETNAACRINDLNGPIASSRNNNYTGTWDEWIFYVNNGPLPVTYTVEVTMVSTDGCTDYDLQIDGASTPGFGESVGTPYCATVVNSSGEPANLWAIGSNVVADNDLTLVSASVPFYSFGFLLVAPQAAFVVGAGGSSGNLCLGGSIGRFVGPGQVQNSGGLGEIDVRVDLTALPQPMGAVAVAPGERWFFQLWMRDATPSGPTSNFSNGVEVLFQ